MEDFKALWREQNIRKPDLEDLRLTAAAFTKSQARRIIKMNVMLITTTIAILIIWYRYEPQFLTSKIGIVLIILAMAIFLTAYNKMFTRLKKSANTMSNADHVSYLIEIKNREKFLQTTMMNLYFMMLSVGIALYMYEYAVRMSMVLALVVYGVTALWIAINWFFFRPRTIRKQRREIDGLIEKFSEINDQLTDSERKK